MDKGLPRPGSTHRVCERAFMVRGGNKEEWKLPTISGAKRAERLKLVLGELGDRQEVLLVRMRGWGRVLSR